MHDFSKLTYLQPTYRNNKFKSVTKGFLKKNLLPTDYQKDIDQVQHHYQDREVLETWD